MVDKDLILVTGASSGIGRNIAICLSKRADLILIGRNRDELEKTKKLCDPGCSAYILEYDLNNLQDLEKNIGNYILEKHLEVTKYVHSAGLMRMLPLKSISIEAMTSMFSVNVMSVALIMKVLTSKRYNNARLKSAVFISSNISDYGAKSMIVYGSSKAALDGLMRGLAVELAPKVRVNSVLPGAILTDMTADILNDEAVVRRMEGAYPLGLGNAEDISNTVKFLLSDDARWITGQQFYVDGGRTVNITG